MSDLYVVAVVAGGALANVLIGAMFIARVTAPQWARLLGLAGIAMAVPLAVASLEAVRLGLGVWAVVLPLIFVAFAIEEVILDEVLHADFRHTRWLGAYLATFYIAQWAVVGAAFLASRPGGFVVLASYFGCLAATAWSYRSVGHGSISR